jgi:hypothetical protein
MEVKTAPVNSEETAPVEGPTGWKVVYHCPNPLEDKECFELIRREADHLKLQFDLHL